MVNSIRRRGSLPAASARAIRKTIGLPRSKSFMWPSHAAPDERQPPSLPSVSRDFTLVSNPSSQDEIEYTPAARPRVRIPRKSSQQPAAIDTDALSAVDECPIQDREPELKPSNDMQNQTQITLAGPVDSSSSPADTSAPPSKHRSRRRVKGPRPRPASMSAAVDGDGRRRYARPARPENSITHEIFETRFENPFRPRSWSATLKREKGSASDTSSQASCTSRRLSVFGMLSTFRRSLVKKSDGDESPRDPSPLSLDSSASSIGASVSSASSRSRWSFCMRNGVPRTDPYGPPYFAQPPIPSADADRGRRAAGRIAT
ncbi:hypothetical protein BD311DRAFT_782010 [Dichomitus squalens]|uniref:Uncharacterized protein n=1 Tax=Dichomitus squalens TaxID=114155 RepID=A0A4Q9M7R5_9APHY|nr:hypothetical protein BD311DRAFT_782010 [Dichomitus squalens]